MNQHTEFARIGESPEQEAHSAPAIRLSLSDIVEEYDTKAAAITEAVAAFHEAETAIKTAACIQATYGSDPFSSDARLYERDVRLALLRSAWKHVYYGLNIESIATAKDRKQLELKLTGTHRNIQYNMATLLFPTTSTGRIKAKDISTYEYLQ